jgi:hypothetical protein
MKKNQTNEEVVDSSEEIVNDNITTETVSIEDVEAVEVLIPEDVAEEVVIEKAAEKEPEAPKLAKEAPVESKDEKRKSKAETQLLKNSQRRKSAAKVSEVAAVKVDPTKNLNLAELSGHTGTKVFEAMNTMLTELADQNAQLRSMNTEMITEMKRVNNKIIEMLDRPIEPKIVIMQPETTKVITKTITRDTNNLIHSVTEKVEDVPVDEKEIITKKDK